MSQPIAPCPFPSCGGEGVAYDTGRAYCVVCSKCGAEGPEADSYADSIAAWNDAPRLTPAAQAVLDAAVEWYNSTEPISQGQRLLALANALSRMEEENNGL